MVRDAVKLPFLIAYRWEMRFTVRRISLGVCPPLDTKNTGGLCLSRPAPAVKRAARLALALTDKERRCKIFPPTGGIPPVVPLHGAPCRLFKPIMLCLIRTLVLRPDRTHCFCRRSYSAPSSQRPIKCSRFLMAASFLVIRLTVRRIYTGRGFQGGVAP